MGERRVREEDEYARIKRDGGRAGGGVSEGRTHRTGGQTGRQRENGHERVLMRAWFSSI